MSKEIPQENYEIWENLKWYLLDSWGPPFHPSDHFYRWSVMYSLWSLCHIEARLLPATIFACNAKFQNPLIPLSWNAMFLTCRNDPKPSQTKKEDETRKGSSFRASQHDSYHTGIWKSSSYMVTYEVLKDDKDFPWQFKRTARYSKNILCTVLKGQGNCKWEWKHLWFWCQTFSTL